MNRKIELAFGDMILVDWTSRVGKVGGNVLSRRRLEIGMSLSWNEGIWLTRTYESAGT